MVHSLRAAVNEARRHGDLYFAALIPKDRIKKALGKAIELWKGWVYTPEATFWTFLSQCLSADHSCREAVARLSAWLVSQGKKSCSAETTRYCEKRNSLPEEGIRAVMQDVGKQVEDEAPPEWLWHGRKVCVADGSTITMPDTYENQKAYPQPESQEPGCGFPIARILVIFSLAVGTVLNAAIGKYKGKHTGENSMFRRLHDTLEEGSVVLADRYFSGWFDMALLQQRGIDLVVRQHQSRRSDFRTGHRLGKGDHLVFVKRPRRPQWMSPEQYATLPEQLTLREVCIRVVQKGKRTEVLTVVTSLLDPKEYPLEDIADLYRRRWQAELNLRSLKSVLQMDHLRCKKPHRVRNEFFMHMVGYNLIRGVMARAAFESKRLPWEISFKGTLQTLNQYLPVLLASPLENWWSGLMKAVATHIVGDRPDRFEPRRVKRRPKPYRLLQKHRHLYTTSDE